MSCEKNRNFEKTYSYETLKMLYSFHTYMHNFHVQTSTSCGLNAIMLRFRLYHNVLAGGMW